MGGRPGGPAEPTTAPMIRKMSVMDKIEYEVALHRERLLRFHSASIDLALDLPPAVPMPDGEEYYQDNRSSIMYHFRNLDQQSELCDNFPKPPPNRTVYGRETLHSYLPPESNSSTKRPTNILGRTMKCLSGKNSQQPSSQESTMQRVPCPPLCVMVPVSHRSRRLSAFSEKAKPGSNLESVPSVQCETPVTTSSSSDVPMSSSSSAKEQSHSTSSSANLCENTTNDTKTDNGNRRERNERSTF